MIERWLDKARTGRTGRVLRKPRRGASPRTQGPSRLRQGLDGFRDGLVALPWRAVSIHLLLFSFWLAVLGGGATLISMADRRVGDIVVSGQLVNVDFGRLEQRLQPFRTRSFFAIDLDEMRAVLEQEAWVREARVSRQWPNAVEVFIVEQQPVVRWGEQGLLNADGELFVPEQPWRAEALIQLDGPEGEHAAVYQRYRDWQAQLASVGLSLASVRQDDRGAWTLVMAEGWVLELGRQDVEQRLAGFMTYFPRIRASRDQEIERIDMRYSSGMAVRWKPSEEAGAVEQSPASVPVALQMGQTVGRAG